MSTVIPTTKINPAVQSDRSGLGRSGLSRSGVIGPLTSLYSGFLRWGKRANSVMANWRLIISEVNLWAPDSAIRFNDASTNDQAKYGYWRDNNSSSNSVWR